MNPDAAFWLSFGVALMLAALAIDVAEKYGPRLVRWARERMQQVRS